MAIILMLPGELAPTRVFSWGQRYARRVPVLHCRGGRRIWRKTCMNRYLSLDRRWADIRERQLSTASQSEMSLKSPFNSVRPRGSGDPVLAEFSALGPRFRGDERRFVQRRCKPNSFRSSQKKLGAPTGAPSKRCVCAHAPARAGAPAGSIVSTESCGLILNQAT